MEIAYRPIRIALLGAGSVGSQVARLLIENRHELAQRVGADLELVGIAVRNLDSARNGNQDHAGGCCQVHRIGNRGSKACL